MADDDDDLDLPADHERSPFRAMEKAVGVAPRLDHAMMLVAAGSSQKVAAKAAGISPSRLCVFIRSERGQSRLNFWLAQELRNLAPKAIRTLDRSMGSKNAIAAVRSAEGVLDRVGLGGDELRSNFGSLTVTLNLGTASQPERTIDHE